MQLPCLHVADIELPREVGRLYELAYNFWWSWTPMARRLFSTIDSLAWTRYRNPVEMLINVDPSRWEALLTSDSFMNTYSTVIREFDRYMGEDGRCWFHAGGGQRGSGPIAYFCMEFGVDESLQGYSGGLGILAGDHLKGASDLCVPIVGVGLLYRRGYFRQAVDADGHQQHMYPTMDFKRLPVRPAAGSTGQEVRVAVELPGREVFAKVWVAQVGRVPLLLLDTDIVQNEAPDRTISGILYVRGREMRLVQEYFLGVGGVRALRAMDIDPAVWHLNEGHSVFLQVERAREMMRRDGLAFHDAVDKLRRSTVFTTHTPVPAGNETFDREPVARILGALTEGLDIRQDELLDMGSAEPGHPHARFNLTAFALRTSRFANGVSALHARVSSDMWRHVLPDRGDGPVQSVSNGVHTPTWLGSAMLEVLNRHLPKGWAERLYDSAGWEAIEAIPDAEVWTAHQAQKERLVRFVRTSLLGQFSRHGHAPDALREIQGWLSPDALSIGFARRFATYKRAHLLFSDLERLRRLVNDPARPLQIILAGKAHPADRPGQELIQYIFGLSQTPELRGRVVFLENYDIRVARAMLQGVDVWLNTPRRPQEASGTSGMKAALNGGLNFSVPDGWWPEAYNGRNGWGIGPDQDSQGDESVRDREDAAALYSILEGEILPAFYERGDGGIPGRWLAMMKSSMASIMPRFSAQHMVKDYAERAYFSEDA